MVASPSPSVGRHVVDPRRGPAILGIAALVLASFALGVPGAYAASVVLALLALATLLAMNVIKPKEAQG